MILTYEQADRFYTLINALLGYANERFEVVSPPHRRSRIPIQGCPRGRDAVG